MEKVNILSIPERVKYYNLLFTFKAIHFELYGNYVKSFFTLKAAGRTRSSSKNTLSETFKNISHTYDNSFRARAIKDWNSLPSSLTCLNISINKFKSDIGKYFVSIRLRNEQTLFVPP